MFDASSRYASIGTSIYVAPDGRQITYVLRRFLPQGSSMQALASVVPIPGERFDLFAARTLGDPLRFWQICDANTAMDPIELLRTPARALIVPVPQLPG